MLRKDLVKIGREMPITGPKARLDFALGIPLFKSCS